MWHRLKYLREDRWISSHQSWSPHIGTNFFFPHSPLHPSTFLSLFIYKVLSPFPLLFSFCFSFDFFLYSLFVSFPIWTFSFCFPIYRPKWKINMFWYTKSYSKWGTEKWMNGAHGWKKEQPNNFVIWIMIFKPRGEECQVGMR